MRATYEHHCKEDSTPGLLLKRRCHSCKCDIPEPFLVPCKTPGCHKFFCRKCLTSRYKYSQAKASRLPSIHWMCPVCARRCYCADCVAMGIIPKKPKNLRKQKLFTRSRRKWKRPRLKKPSVETSKAPQPNCDPVQGSSDTAKCHGCGTSTNGSAGGPRPSSGCPSPTPKHNSQPLLPAVPVPTPPQPPPLMLEDSGYWPAPHLSAPFPRYSNVNKGMGRGLGPGERIPLLTYDDYDAMSIGQLLRLVSIPFLQEHGWERRAFGGLYS